MVDSERPNVRHLWPLLMVRDIEESVRFYGETLGFEIVGKAESDDGVFWCRLQRGDACFMLQQRGEGATTTSQPAPEVAFYFVCDDADELHAEFLRKGLPLDPPALADYGMLQVFVPDPDGFVVCFESPTEAWVG